MKKAALIFAIAVVIISLMSPTAEAKNLDSFIKLNEPKDNFITTKSNVVVSGESIPDTCISLLVNGNLNSCFSVGAAGVFITQAPLNARENVITVKAQFPSGKSEMISRRVYQKGSYQELDSLFNTIRTFLIIK